MAAHKVAIRVCEVPWASVFVCVRVQGNSVGARVKGLSVRLRAFGLGWSFGFGVFRLRQVGALSLWVRKKRFNPEL